MASKGFGGWAFLVGILLAVIFGFIQTANWAVMTLFIIGIIVGLLNVTDKEVTPFLMAGAVLVIVSSLGRGYITQIDWITNMLGNVMVIFVPATVVVAIKSVFSLAKN